MSRARLRPATSISLTLAVGMILALTLAGSGEIGRGAPSTPTSFGGRCITPACQHDDQAPPTGARTRRAGGDPGDISLFAGEYNGFKAATRCDGDGHSGHRTQAVYAHVAGTVDSYKANPGVFQEILTNVNGTYEHSSGGTRAIRWFHDGNCQVKILDLAVPANVLTNANPYGATIGYLGSHYHAQVNGGRANYLIWLSGDTPHLECGIGNYADDTRHGSINRNNHPGGVAMVWQRCTGGLTEAHELGHTLGAVQASAPHHTTYGHCTDGADVMCYADGSPQKQRSVCTSARSPLSLDCRHDDYFSINPRAGSYLATHWNSADSVFLIHSSAHPLATLPTAPSNVSAHASGPTSVDLTWSPSAGAAAYHIQHVAAGQSIESGVPDDLFVPHLTTTTTSITVPVNHNEYNHFVVYAVNAAGVSEANMDVYAGSGDAPDQPVLTYTRGSSGGPDEVSWTGGDAHDPDHTKFFVIVNGTWNGQDPKTAESDPVQAGDYSPSSITSVPSGSSIHIDAVNPYGTTASATYTTP